MIESRNWTAYNAAQSEEKRRFVALLADLCSAIPQPERAPGAGRSRLPLSDMIFASVFKVYVGFSSRRFTCDLHDAYADGLIDTKPHFNSVSRYLANPMLAGVLKSLIATSSLPLKAVESDFAVDSSGFSTSRFVRWYSKKHQRVTDNREWVKLHLMCGTTTKVVTGVEVSGWTAHDTNYFVPLIERTAASFDVERISADKAYLSHKNTDAVESIGATPFIPFKSNSLPPAEESAWSRMYHYFMFNREEFLQHYHRRSNIESAFSMIKGKFGDSLRSKSDTGQVNEALAKVLCHNLCVLIHAIHALEIEPNFSAESRPALKLVK